MRFNEYTFYPETIKKLENAGIISRINELKNSEEGLPGLWGFISQTEVMNFVKFLNTEGYYKNLPKEFSKKYKERMNRMLNDPEEFYWEINKHQEKIKEPCNLEDLLILAGKLSCSILNAEEIWEYEKFGFSSPSEFLLTVGHFINQKAHDRNSFDRGYTWERTTKEKIILTNEITGDINADLRINQKDITPYETFDPFGEKIGFRPVFENDRKIIAAYHSTESSLLVGVLKYIDQEKIKTEYQKDHYKELIEWGKSLGQRGGTCAEHFGGYDQHPKNFFYNYFASIPKLNQNNETNVPSRFNISTVGDGFYSLYISNTGNLIFSYENRNNFKNPKKTIRAEFFPEDSAHLIKGLIYQSANGLGRTSAKQLLNIIEYRYSPQFEIN